MPDDQTKPLSVEKQAHMTLKFGAIDHHVRAADPVGKFFAADEAEFSVQLRQSKVFHLCKRECSVSHNSVTRGSRPTCFDGQTSHTVANDEKCSDHIRMAVRKIMRIFALYCDRTMISQRFACDFDNCVDQPSNASGANSVIGSFEAKIIGDITVARSDGLRGGFTEHLRPDLIEFSHKARIGRSAPKGNFVITF